MPVDYPIVSIGVCLILHFDSHFGIWQDFEILIFQKLCIVENPHEISIIVIIIPMVSISV